jgi:hypothetical protein
MCLLALSGDETPSSAASASSSVETRADILPIAPASHMPQVYPAMAAPMMAHLSSPPPSMMSMQMPPHMGVPTAYHFGASASAPACAAGPYFYAQAMRHMPPPYMASPFSASPAPYLHGRMLGAPTGYHPGMSTTMQTQSAPQLVYVSQPALVPA